ncbi:MAG: sulfur carrier protein ThiS [Pseudomonadota bacterium]
MKITLNGKEFIFKDSSLEELLVELNLKSKSFALQVNQNIVSKSAYKNYYLSDGDKVELVQFVGGG